MNKQQSKAAAHYVQHADQQCSRCRDGFVAYWVVYKKEQADA